MSDEISFCCFSYAIKKQLPSAYSLNTSYGELELDEEMKSAIKEALFPILERRIDESLMLSLKQNQVTPETVSQKGICLDHSSQSQINHTNVITSCSSCGEPLSPFSVCINHFATTLDHPGRGLCSACYKEFSRKRRILNAI